MRPCLATCLLLLVLSLCAALAQELPVPDAGFEQTPLGWSGVSRYPGTVQADRAIKRSGEASVHITGKDGHVPWLAATVPGLRGGATYELRAWYRGVEGGQGTVALKIEYYNAQKQNTLGRYSAAGKANKTAWQQLALEMKSPVDTDYASVIVRVTSPGEAWFDDVTFTMTKAPPPVSSITERVPVEAGKTTTVPLELRFREPFGPPPEPTIAVTRRDGTTVPGARAQFKASAANVLTGTVTLPALQNADHTLRLTFPQGDISFGVFPYAADRKPRRLTETGSLLVGGKPFFPIGIYHVSVSEYPLLAEHGFNAVQGLVSADLPTYENQFRQAQATGIMVDVPFYLGNKVAANVPLSLRKVALTKDHPALLNWKIIDEPDLRPEVIDDVADAYRQYKAADPQTPILLTIAGPSGFPFWINYCDMLQVDLYPIPRWPLTLVSDTVKAAVAVKQPWQHVTSVLQCGWVANPDGTPANQPTYDQALSMVYLSLISGAKGIGWFAMHEASWDLSKTPLWGRFAELNRATARLGEIVLSDQPLATTVAGDMIQAKAWQYEGQTYLLVTNPDKQPHMATIKLDRPVTGCGGATGTVDARVEAGAVQVSLPPYASHTMALR